MLAWHPTKRQILITTAFGNVPQLHLVDGPGRDRRQLTWFDEASRSSTNVSFDPADPQLPSSFSTTRRTPSCARCTATT